MLAKLSGSSRIVCLVIFLVVSNLYQNGKAEPYLDSKYCLTPKILIYLLNRNSSKDYIKGLFVQNSMILQKAPPIHEKKWLIKSLQHDVSPAAKVTILEFWNINCGPCIASIPKNKQLAKWIKGRDGKFISIHSASDGVADIERFLKKHAIEYPVVLDSFTNAASYWNSKTFFAYGINTIPTYVTVDKDGRILSYAEPTNDYLELLLAKSKNLKPAKRELKIEPVIIAPPEFIMEDVLPGSKVESQIFVYRLDTPNLVLVSVESGNKYIDVVSTKFSAQGQTVYELSVKATALNWGEVLKDEINLVVEYHGEEKLLKVPCKIKSRDLIEYTPPLVFFGQVKAGEEITRSVFLKHFNEQTNIKLISKFAPRELDINIEEVRENRIIIMKAIFSSQKVGMHKGNLELQVSDNNGNEKNIKLEYYAFVH